MNYAYVTLLCSSDYITPVLALNRNLIELHSKYPLYVIVTEDVDEKTISYLQKEQIHFIRVPVIHYSEETLKQLTDTRLRRIASKINIFTLKNFDKVIYLDADSFFIKNIDELFNYPDGSLYNPESPEYQGRGFCGLFVCIPQNHNFDYYLSLLHSRCMWESDLIEELWFPFKSNEAYRIPFSYFVNFTGQNFEYLSLIQKPIYGIHFCNHLKPWNYTEPEQFIRDFNKHYTPSLDNKRIQAVKFYFTHYLSSLKKDFPELFTKGDVNES